MTAYFNGPFFASVLKAAYLWRPCCGTKHLVSCLLSSDGAASACRAIFVAVGSISFVRRRQRGLLRRQQQRVAFPFAAMERQRNGNAFGLSQPYPCVDPIVIHAYGIGCSRQRHLSSTNVTRPEESAVPICVFRRCYEAASSRHASKRHICQNRDRQGLVLRCRGKAARVQRWDFSLILRPPGSPLRLGDIPYETCKTSVINVQTTQSVSGTQGRSVAQSVIAVLL